MILCHKLGHLSDASLPEGAPNETPSLSSSVPFLRWCL
jgi:hypothetical protein